MQKNIPSSLPQADAQRSGAFYGCVPCGASARKPLAARVTPMFRYGHNGFAIFVEERI
jgi:hypothetical protein